MPTLQRYALLGGFLLTGPLRSCPVTYRRSGALFSTLRAFRVYSLGRLLPRLCFRRFLAGVSRGDHTNPVRSGSVRPSRFPIFSFQRVSYADRASRPVATRVVPRIAPWRRVSPEGIKRARSTSWPDALDVSGGSGGPKGEVRQVPPFSSD